MHLAVVNQVFTVAVILLVFEEKSNTTIKLRCLPVWAKMSHRNVLDVNN